MWNTTHFEATIKEQSQLGVESQLIIAHTPGIRNFIEDHYPGKFVFAKYLSTKHLIGLQIDPVLTEIKAMRSEGFSLAKMWAAPGWRNYLKDMSKDFHITNPRLAPIFQCLADEGFPLLLHVSDPDTYYATAYSNAKVFGTKEGHLDELETLIQTHPDLQFQLAHFAAQPEIHRLPHLANWFDKYDNIVVDTASSRWMARELSKDPQAARKFLTRYSKRVLFGTDGTLNASPTQENASPFSPYAARLIAQRILWETDDQEVPLPFPDRDTEAFGGTFINGLNLSKRVLKDLYWGNSQRLYAQ
jgi:predicted TIM-barrel fold metal-dependent hydrolase